MECRIRLMSSAIINMFSICLLWNPLLINCAWEFIIAHYPPADNSLRKNFIYRQLYRHLIETFISYMYLVSVLIFCCLPIYVFFLSFVFMCICHVPIKCLLTYLLTYLETLTSRLEQDCVDICEQVCTVRKLFSIENGSWYWVGLVTQEMLGIRTRS